MKQSIDKKQTMKANNNNISTKSYSIKKDQKKTSITSSQSEEDNSEKVLIVAKKKKDYFKKQREELGNKQKSNIPKFIVNDHSPTMKNEDTFEFIKPDGIQPKFNNKSLNDNTTTKSSNNNMLTSIFPLKQQEKLTSITNTQNTVLPAYRTLFTNHIKYIQYICHMCNKELIPTDYFKCSMFLCEQVFCMDCLKSFYV